MAPEDEPTDEDTLAWRREVMNYRLWKAALNGEDLSVVAHEIEHEGVFGAGDINVELESLLRGTQGVARRLEETLKERENV